MASFFYVIVPASAARDLGLDTVRKKIPGGCFLLTQKDFATMPGGTLYQRVEKFGGVLVSEAEALQILNGVTEPPIKEPEILSPETEEKEEVEPIPEESEDTGTNNDNV